MSDFSFVSIGLGELKVEPEPELGWHNAEGSYRLPSRGWIVFTLPAPCDSNDHDRYKDWLGKTIGFLINGERVVSRVCGVETFAHAGSYKKGTPMGVAVKL